jgi:hypothetical protein
LVRDLAEALDQPLPLLGLENLAELLQVPAGRERVAEARENRRSCGGFR